MEPKNDVPYSFMYRSDGNWKHESNSQVMNDGNFMGNCRQRVWIQVQRLWMLMYGIFCCWKLVVQLWTLWMNSSSHMCRRGLVSQGVQGSTTGYHWECRLRIYSTSSKCLLLYQTHDEGISCYGWGLGINKFWYQSSSISEVSDVFMGLVWLNLAVAKFFLTVYFGGPLGR